MEPRPILLVDDDDDIRESVRTLLEDEGYSVVLAEDGVRALELLRDGLRPSLVLLDLMMPGMDGWTVLEEAQNDIHLNTLPFVVFTAAMPCDRERIVRRPTLRKPIDPDLLLDMVREMSRTTFNDEPPSDLLPKTQ